MRKYSLLIRTLFGIVILAFLIYKLDFKEVSKAIAGIGIIAVLLLILKYLLEISINTANIKILLSSTGEKISFFRLLKYLIVSYSIGLFSLGRIGDLSLIPLLKKESIDYGKSAPILFLDRLITFISLAIFSGYGFFLFLPKNNAIGISVLLLFIIIISISLLFLKRIREFTKKHLLRKYQKNFRGFSKNLYLLLREKKKALFIDLILTITSIIGGAIILNLILIHAGIKVNPLIIAGISSAGKIISIIPISLSGLGIRESVIVYFYSLLGISPVIIGSIYIVNVFVYYILAGLFVLILMRLLLPDAKI